MQLTDAGYQKLLLDATDNTAAGTHTGLLVGAKVMYFTAANRQDRGAVITDLTEATFTGYAQAAVGPWSAPFKDGVGEWKVEAPGVTMIATDGVNPNTVVGAGLVTGVAPNQTLLALEMFAAPVNMEAAGNGFTYPPALILPVGPWSGNQPIE